MWVCPVCEHPQEQGDTCDVCGKQRVLGPVGDAPVAALEGLEVTRLEGGGEVPTERLAELEVTPLRSGPDLPAQVLPELERTSTDAIGEIPVLPMDEIELGRTEDNGPKTPEPTGEVVCRYCRHVQAEGLLCEACGMRLPRAPRAPAPSARPGIDDEIWGTCPKCGSRAMVGRRCGECGVVMQMPEV
jgi:methionyl-tRNA synthetase